MLANRLVDMLTYSTAELLNCWYVLLYAYLRADSFAWWCVDSYVSWHVDIMLCWQIYMLMGMLIRLSKCWRVDVSADMLVEVLTEWYVVLLIRLLLHSLMYHIVDMLTSQSINNSICRLFLMRSFRAICRLLTDEPDMVIKPDSHNRHVTSVARRMPFYLLQYLPTKWKNLFLWHSLPRRAVPENPPLRHLSQATCTMP